MTNRQDNTATVMFEWISGAVELPAPKWDIVETADGTFSLKGETVILHGLESKGEAVIAKKMLEGR